MQLHQKESKPNHYYQTENGSLPLYLFHRGYFYRHDKPFLDTPAFLKYRTQIENQR
jgi:hypothetical protein